jgi:drug/metabolite transporter (DMT)-like permease
MNTTWIFYLIVYVIAFAVYGQMLKKALKDSQNNTAASILIYGLSGAACLVLVPFFEWKFTADIGLFALFFASCALFAVNIKLELIARKHLPVSEFTIIHRFYLVFLVLIGILFFHDGLPAMKAIGGGLIILASMLSIYDGRRFRFNRYVFAALMSALFLAVGLSIAVSVTKRFNIPFYEAMGYFVPAIVLAVSLGRNGPKKVRQEFYGKEKYYLIAAFAIAVTTVSLIRALQLGSVAITAPLLSLSVFVTVIAAALFLGERKMLGLKIAATGLILIGVYLMSIG